MASTPKRRRLRAALARRAEAEIGPGAAPLDYVEQWVASGGLITELAANLQAEMGESNRLTQIRTGARQCRGPDAGETRGAGSDVGARARSMLSGSIPERRPGDVVELPDLTAERNDVGGIVDDLDRGWPIQPADDGR